MAVGDWLAQATSCRITTRGRLTGEPHRVTVWFCLDGRTVYVLSRHGASGDWVRNVQADPDVTISHRQDSLPGTARVVADPAENRRGREAMYAKYSPRHRGLESWLSGDATVVVIDLHAAAL